MAPRPDAVCNPSRPPVGLVRGKEETMSYRDERGRYARDPFEDHEDDERAAIELDQYYLRLEIDGHVHPNVRLNQPCPACERAQRGGDHAV